MTEMQVHEERVMNLVESSSGNPTITPLTKTNAHRAESIRRIGTDKDAVAFHFRKKSKRVCRNDASSFLYKQSPDFPKPGLCHVQKNLHL